MNIKLKGKGEVELNGSGATLKKDATLAALNEVSREGTSSR
jgi:hypothetical protein